MFRVWDVLDVWMPLERVAEHARRAEALGYDGVSVPDAVHDGLLAAAIALRATTRLRVATSALVAFARSPMTVAVAAWDLQALSGGRFQLGLGPQVRANIVDRYGASWTPPAPRMREYVQALRSIFDCWQNGAPLRFEGRHYRFTRMQPFMKPEPLEHPGIPIFLGAIGAHMTALAGELADGLMTHPTNTSPRFVRERVRPNLERGAARSGRKLDEVRLLLAPLCATGRDWSEVGQQREHRRALLATLYSTPTYWPSLELFGWKERGERLHGLAREGRWSEMTALVNDEMLDALIPAAPYAELAGLLREAYGGLSDSIAFPMPEDPALDAEARRAIEALRE